MRVKLTVLDQELKELLTLGTVYTVLGMSISLEPDYAEHPTSVLIVREQGSPLWVNIDVFELIDSRVSKYWEVLLDEQNICLLPPEMRDTHFVESWYDDHLEEKKVFWKVFTSLATEFGLIPDEWQHFQVSSYDIILARLRDFIQSFLMQEINWDEFKHRIDSIHLVDGVIRKAHSREYGQNELIAYILGLISSSSESDPNLNELFNDALDFIQGKKDFYGMDVSILPLVLDEI